MAEKSYPWTENGSGDGTTGGYTALEWGEINRRFIDAGNEASGVVVRGHGNELAVSGTSSPLAVATGAACVYGKMYHNDASKSLTVTTPVVGTTGGHVILRLDWSAQTVRLVAVRNTDGVNSTPSLTQSTSTQWEIRLASFTITTGGVITVTDARTFHGPKWDAANGRMGIGSGAGTPSNLLDIITTAASTIAARVRNLSSSASAYAAMQVDNDGASTAGIFRNSSANTGYAGANSLNLLTLGAHAIGICTNNLLRLIVDSAGRLGIGVASPSYELDLAGQQRISPASAAAPLVLGTNGQGQRVDGLHADEVDTLAIRRQGGSSSVWGTAGTSNYTPADARVECGAISDPGGGVTVTFPTAFAQVPIVIAQAVGNTTVEVIPGASSATFTCYNPSTGAAKASTVYWIAIGPRT